MFGPNYRRTWLWRSVAIGVIGQAGLWNGLLDAQSAPLTPVPGAQPQLKRVPTGGSVSQVQGTAPANTDISRQLEMLYRQDGRDVPEYLQSPGAQAPAQQPVYQAPQAAGRPMAPSYQPVQQQRPAYAPQPGQIPAGPRPPQQYARPGAVPAGMPRQSQYGNPMAPGMRVPPGSNGYYQPQPQQGQAPAYQTYPASMAQPSYQQPAYNQQGYNQQPQPAPKGNPVTGFFKKLMGGKSAQPAQPYAPTNVAPTPPDYARTQGMIPQAPGADDVPARMIPAAPQSAAPAVISAVPSATPIVTNILDAYGVPPSPAGGAPQYVATTTPRVEAAPVQQPVISPAPQQPVTQQPVVTATPAPAQGPSLALPPAPQPAAAPATSPAATTPQAAPGIATARSAPELPMLPPVADDAPAFVPEPASPAATGQDVAAAAEAKSPEADPFDLANAFPEMSEAAADGDQKKETPFTGLALDEADDVDMTAEEPAASAETAQAKTPAPTEQPVLEAPGAPRLELPPVESEAAATAKTEPVADPFAEDPFASQPIEPEPKKEPAATAPALAAPASDDPFAPSPKQAPIAEKPARADGAPALLPQTPAANAAPVAKATPSEADEKMRRIRERDGMTGLKGFCPVTLRDQRELRDAQTQFESAYRGQKYHFASADAKLRFEANPARYAPAAYGADVVSLARDKDVVEGTLDHAAWFRGRLYLFGSQTSHDEFVANPIEFAVGVDED